MPYSTTPIVPPGRMSAAPQPTLVAGDLVLRPWTPDDWPVVVAAHADPAIRYWHARILTDEAGAAEWIAQRSGAWGEETGAEWAVSDGSTILGRVAIYHLDLHDGVGEIGYWVLPEARGRGVATRAGAAAVDWAFGTLGIERVQLEHSALNTASCEVARRLGMPLEGVLRAHLLHSDGRHDTHLHGRVAPGVEPVERPDLSSIGEG
ncbi:acetyltransferase [Cellulomonas chitinilytica]|uniref:Acetyltransferase n=1 Tax=Cellulomonas chitinilytica TaxID=398759 RepID=A0A919P126_9CELL|nr:GNAT family N-acetyltransferase [Cellulomonas chitinilytica]GIG21348.1 acetyltransferase [Cellulomonas chitinilytica]